MLKIPIIMKDTKKKIQMKPQEIFNSSVSEIKIHSMGLMVDKTLQKKKII
jgi:hypothetical protein